MDRAGFGGARIITAGIDAGMVATKVAIIGGPSQPEYAILPGGVKSASEVAEATLLEAAKKADISPKDIAYTVVTGVGREYITFANEAKLEFPCLAKGIDSLLPSTKTVIDLSAQKSLALRCSGGNVVKMARSTKCASGTGSYLEMVANVLNIPVDSMDELYFKSKENLEIISLCAVFAESEIISLLHSGVKPEDLVRGVFKGLAGRVYSQLLQLGVAKDVAVVGGIAGSKAMVSALEERIGFKIVVPDHTQVVSALGAALIARDALRRAR